MDITINAVLKWFSTFGQRVEDIWDVSDGVLLAEIFHMICREYFEGPTMRAGEILGNWVCATHNTRNLYTEIDNFFAAILPYDTHLRFLPFVDVVGVAKKTCKQSILVTAQLGLVAMCRMDNEDRLKCILACLNSMTPLENAVLLVLVEQFWFKVDKLYNHMTKEEVEQATKNHFMFLDCAAVVEQAKQKLKNRDTIPYTEFDSIFRSEPKRYGIEVSDGRKGRTILPAALSQETQKPLTASIMKRNTIAETKPEDSGNPLLNRLQGIKSPITSSVDQICSRLRLEDIYAKKRFTEHKDENADQKAENNEAEGEKKEKKAGETGDKNDDVYADIINRTMKDSVRDQANNVLANAEKGGTQKNVRSQAYLQQLQLQMWIFAHRKRSRKKYALLDYVPPHERMKEDKWRGKPVPSASSTDKGVMKEKDYIAAKKELKEMKKKTRVSIRALVKEARKTTAASPDKSGGNDSSSAPGTPSPEKGGAPTSKEYLFHALWHSYTMASCRTPMERYKLARAAARKRKVQQFVDALEQAEALERELEGSPTGLSAKDTKHQSTTAPPPPAADCIRPPTTSGTSKPLSSANSFASASTRTSKRPTPRPLDDEPVQPPPADFFGGIASSVQPHQLAMSPQATSKSPNASSAALDGIHLEELEVEDNNQTTVQSTTTEASGLTASPRSLTTGEGYDTESRKVRGSSGRAADTLSSTSTGTTSRTLQTSTTASKVDLPLAVSCTKDPHSLVLGASGPTAEMQMDRWLQCKAEQYTTADHGILANAVARGVHGPEQAPSPAKMSGGMYSKITRELSTIPH